MDRSRSTAGGGDRTAHGKRGSLTHVTVTGSEIKAQFYSNEMIRNISWGNLVLSQKDFCAVTLWNTDIKIVDEKAPVFSGSIPRSTFTQPIIEDNIHRATNREKYFMWAKLHTGYHKKSFYWKNRAIFHRAISFGKHVLVDDNDSVLVVSVFFLDSLQFEWFIGSELLDDRLHASSKCN